MNPSMTNEQSLIAACISNDRTAQRKLYELYAGRLFAVAMRYVKNREEAQDVLQDAFVKIFRKLDTFRFDCPFEGWLKKIVTNTALNQLRDRPDYNTHFDIEQASESIESNENLLAGFQYQQLIEMIARLPDGCQTIFNLYAIEGYPHKEIAEMLGISDGTSKSQYSRAKVLLQSMILKEKQHIDGAFREV
jgi:RNA polymerase sigma factor (sigma-70 family)